MVRGDIAKTDVRGEVRDRPVFVESRAGRAGSLAEAHQREETLVLPTVTAQPHQLLHQTYAFCLRVARRHSTRLQLPGRLCATAMTFANTARHAAIGMSLVGGRRIGAKGRKQRRPHTARVSWTGAPSWAWRIVWHVPDYGHIN